MYRTLLCFVCGVSLCSTVLSSVSVVVHLTWSSVWLVVFVACFSFVSPLFLYWCNLLGLLCVADLCWLVCHVLAVVYLSDFLRWLCCLFLGVASLNDFFERRFWLVFCYFRRWQWILLLWSIFKRYYNLLCASLLLFPNFLYVSFLLLCRFQFHRTDDEY